MSVQPYWDDGRVTIYHGDCREVLPELAPVDLVLTDPPYAMGSSRGEWRVTASVGTGLHLAARKVKKGGAALVLATTSGRGIEYTIGAVGGALPFNRLLVWHKDGSRSRVAGPWQWDAVAILAFGRASFGAAGVSSVYRSTEHRGHRTEHPAELPEDVAEWLYAPIATPETVVLDPFAGAGTLLLPAARRGRRAIGIEIEERYCEAAVERLAEPARAKPAGC
jgi:site-specific DNA-methyltransferase (adenine-specific)